MNESALNNETFDWKQKKLEEGKFPCAICTHFEGAHISGLCIVCHNHENDPDPVHQNCFHPFKQMPNLDIIEWMSQHKDDK